MATQTTERTLTLAEAEARLPLVRRIVRDAVQLHQQIQETRERLSDMRHRRGEKSLQDIYAEEWLAIEQELEQDSERLAGFSRELAQLGAKLLDTPAGIVSFASLRDGAPIALSWKLDEPQIGFWHRMDQAPTQRLPLEIRGRDTADGPGVNRIEARFDESA
jgi:hypothetical protein